MVDLKTPLHVLAISTACVGRFHCMSFSIPLHVFFDFPRCKGTAERVNNQKTEKAWLPEVGNHAFSARMSLYIEKYEQTG